MRSTQKDRTTGTIFSCDECFPWMKMYRKTFAITHAQENEQGTNLNVKISYRAHGKVGPTFEYSPLQEVLNFLHNLFASESLSCFFLYPVNYDRLAFLSRKDNNSDIRHIRVSHTSSYTLSMRRRAQIEVLESKMPISSQG